MREGPARETRVSRAGQEPVTDERAQTRHCAGLGALHDRGTSVSTRPRRVRAPGTTAGARKSPSGSRGAARRAPKLLALGQ